MIHIKPLLILLAVFSGCHRQNADPGATIPPTPETATNAGPNDWPQSVDEAVDTLLAELPDEDRQLLRDTPRECLIRFHHGFGTGIRNAFGLWAGNNALLDSCAQRRPEYAALRERYAPRRVRVEIHPDDASMIIIEALWDTLQQRGEPHAEE